jgi:hypothetical protein
VIMILKQRFKNHIVVSEFTWTSILILLGIWWYLDYDSDVLFIGGLFHLVFSIPALYMHVEYSIRNAGEEIEINPNELIVRKNGLEHSYHNSDLAKIIVYKSASLDRGGVPLSAMEYYRYARIITKKGDEIIITCLMVLKVEEAVKTLQGVPYERKKGLAFLFLK